MQQNRINIEFNTTFNETKFFANEKNVESKAVAQLKEVMDSKILEDAARFTKIIERPCVKKNNFINHKHNVSYNKKPLGVKVEKENIIVKGRARGRGRGSVLYQQATKFTAVASGNTGW